MSNSTIRALALSHFRSHRLTRLALDGRPVVIHGNNGAGKTNILEAISLLSPGRGLRRARADEIARRPETLGWKVSAQVTLSGRVCEIETSAEDGTPRTVRVDEKPVSQTTLGQMLRIVWLVPSMDRLWTEGAEGRRRFLDRITLSFFPDHAEATLSYEKAMRERNRLLKQEMRDDHWYTALERQMAEAGDRIHRNRSAVLSRVADAQAKAETAFPAADLNLVYGDDPAPSDAGALRAALAASRRRDLQAGRTLTGPHRSDLSAVYAEKGIAAKDCSTGEQKALLVSLVLSNARALRADHGAAPLLLLDEVAAHLDAARRAALYDEIIGLKAQAWMTGTGAELFEAFEERAQRFEVTEHGGMSHVSG